MVPDIARVRVVENASRKEVEEMNNAFATLRDIDSLETDCKVARQKMQPFATNCQTRESMIGIVGLRNAYHLGKVIYGFRKLHDNIERIPGTKKITWTVYVENELRIAVGKANRLLMVFDILAKYPRFFTCNIYHSQLAIAGRILLEYLSGNPEQAAFWKGKD